MLSFFRTNQASAGLLLFFYAAALQLPAWLSGAPLSGPLPATGVAGQWLTWLIGESGWLSFFLPVFLVTGQGIVANSLVTRHRMSRQVTQFPGLFLVLCWALVPAFHQLHPVQVANFLLLLGLLSMGRVYKKDEPAVALFNAGAWLGVASLFSPPFLLLLPAFVIGIGKLRRLTLRSIIQLLTGLGLMYFLAFSVLYVGGGLAAGLSAQQNGFGPWRLPTLGLPDLPGVIALLMLLITAIISYGTVVRLLNIEGKKNTSILAWLIFFGGLSLLGSAGSGLAYLQVITVPVGIITGLRFITLPNGRAEFFHLVLITAALSPLLVSLFG